MDWIWSNGGGTALFDVYSLQHIVWFIAVTTILYCIYERHAIIAVVAVAIMWEIFEFWVVRNLEWFPFAGSEEMINKMIGDPISNMIGFLIANYCINCIRNNNEQR